MYLLLFQSLNFISLRNLSFRETLESFNLCTQIWAKKSEKVNHTTPKEKKKKVREIRRVLSLSLSLSFSASWTRARAIALVSLFCSSLLFALFSSERRERIKRAKVKDKKILWCTWCCAFPEMPFRAPKVSETQKSDVLFRKNLSWDFKGPVFASLYSSSRSKKSFWLSSSQRERFNRDTQTDRQISPKTSDRKDPFLSAKRVNCNRSTS